MRLAKRITDTGKKSFGMYERAIARMAAGADVISLQLGRPHHDTPEVIKEAAIRALRDGHVHYSDLQGEPLLRQAIASKLVRDNGIAATPEDVLVTNGLTQASYAAIMALIDPGDEVIVLEPWYPQHIGKIELAGGRAVPVPLDAADRFSIRADWVERAITPATRAIMLVNPANPTGRVHTRKELSALADVAIRRDLIVMSDEVYEKILFDGHRHVSIASLPGMAERTVSMFAFTKAYAMDGWRLGYVHASPALIAAFMKITANEVTHVNSFIQYGALAALTEADAELAAMVADDLAKRDYVVRRLNAMPGVSCPVPEGTIYAFPAVALGGGTSQQLAEAILDQVDVVVEAGSFYGATGEGHLRICFGAQPDERLFEAMDRLDQFFGRRNAF
jgi:aspartate aminotransferase